MKTFTTAILSLVVIAIGVKAAVVESTGATVKPIIVAANNTDLAGVSPAPIESSLVGNDTALDVNPCYWDGTAPFCAGSCPTGYVDCGRDSCGDGACCWTGIKVYCCREGSDAC